MSRPSTASLRANSVASSVAVPMLSGRSTGGMGDDPNSRKRLEAALQLLHEYGERNPALDDKDLERIRAITTVGGSGGLGNTTGSTRGSTPPPVGSGSVSNSMSNLKRRAGSLNMPSGSGANAGAGGGRVSAVDKRIKEMQRRVFVSETIMKKLHNKNKALQKEINMLREQISAGGGVPITTTTAAPATSSSSSGDLPSSSEFKAALKRHEQTIQQQKLYITELETRFRQQQQLRTGAETGSLEGKPAEELAVVSRNLKALQQQYSDLLNIKVDSVVNAGASTSKINKEVKQFFVVLRKKLHEEMTSREAERIVMNEQMYLLEKELMSKQVSNKMLQSQLQPANGAAGAPGPSLRASQGQSSQPRT